MIRVGFIRLVLLVGVLVVSLSGCGCFYQSVRGEKAPPAPSAAVTKTAPSHVKEVKAAPAPAAPAVVSAVVLKDVHFDFDKYLIRPQDAEILKQDFSWLKANPGKRVRVEGNCDERGTEEYNRSLGERRALALREQLVLQGIEPNRIETVSYGKDKPRNPAHDETAWTENRRGDFVVILPQ